MKIRDKVRARKKEHRSGEDAQMVKTIDGDSSNGVAKAKTSRPIALVLGVMAFAVLIVVCVLLKNNNTTSNGNGSGTPEDGSGNAVADPLGITLPGQGRVATNAFSVTEGERSVDYMFQNNFEGDDPGNVAEFEAIVKCEDGTEAQVVKTTKASGSGRLNVNLKDGICRFEVTKGADNVFWEFSILVSE